jgi:hypothetical protein
MLKNSMLLVVIAASLLSGCGEKPSLLPNRDKTLNKTKAQFAADAAKRHPYKSSAPRGGEAPARAQVGYTLNHVDIVNLSSEPWSDVEVWVNQKYVVFVPNMPPNDLKTLDFTMLFDDQGNYFPLDNNKALVNKVEIYRDGKMYDVPVKLGD